MVHHTKNTNSASAASASSRISHMIGRRLRSNHPHRPVRASLALIIAAFLAACGQLPTHHPATPIPPAQPPVPGLHKPSASPETQADGSLAWDRARARWVATDWPELPGWTQDRVGEAWSALWRSCQRATGDWLPVCTRARTLGANWGREAGDETVRQWLETNLRPWRVQGHEGQTTGLLTGYFEPQVDAMRAPFGAFQTPLFRAPADLVTRKPYYTRAELDTLPEARAALAGRELVYVADPLDALMIQVQGSTRIRVLDELTPEGQPRQIRLAFAGHNNQPYQSVARWLVDQGAFPLEQASWGAIRGWAGLNPQRVPEMLRANPRVVFFREEPLTRPDEGPLGAQAVPLTPGRSIAVDRDAVPYGTPVWLDSTEPQAWSANQPAPKPLQRLVVAQDTGGAIVGPVRADYFWGWGDEAMTQAGRTKQPLRVWALWPRDTASTPSDPARILGDVGSGASSVK
ncbi:transglycosylase [Aquabacterium soli]|uniref:peptidoglycan lytic exotransglycosylase n=2 Tax=Aquabacterium soli TaxID=2493092 RepID=A0A426VAK2_9BURK|nr:transglycosylase [Aquabacterium soli]